MFDRVPNMPLNHSYYSGKLRASIWLLPSEYDVNLQMLSADTNGTKPSKASHIAFLTFPIWNKIGAGRGLEKLCKISNVLTILNDVKDFCCLDLKSSLMFCFTTFC